MKKIKFFRLYLSNQGVGISIRTNSLFIYRMLRDSAKYIRTKKGNRKKRIEFKFILNELASDFNGKNHIFEEYFDKSEYTQSYYPKILSVSVKEDTVRGWIKSPYPAPLISLELLYTLPLRYLLEQNNIFQIHAAALTYKNKGILIAGKHLCGKSTLALKLLCNDFKLLCEEDTFLKINGSSIKAFHFSSNKINTKPGILKLFKNNSLSGDLLPPPYNKLSFDAHRIGKTALHSKIDVLFFPQYKRCKHAYINPIPKKEALKRLISDRENFRLFSNRTLNIHRQKFSVFHQLCRRTKTYSLYYCDSNLDEVPNLIRDIFKMKG